MSRRARRNLARQPGSLVRFGSRSPGAMSPSIRSKPVQTAATPKPRKRIKDPKATHRKLAKDGFCRAHRAAGQLVRATNTHHLLGKGQGGDDVEPNLIPLCGHGSAGCHGALHGNPYTDGSGRRWEASDVRASIGAGLRPDEIAALVERLGEAPALEHLRRFYYVDVELGRALT